MNGLKVDLIPSSPVLYEAPLVGGLLSTDALLKHIKDNNLILSPEDLQSIINARDALEALLQKMSKSTTSIRL